MKTKNWCCPEDIVIASQKMWVGSMPELFVKPFLAIEISHLGVVLCALMLKATLSIWMRAGVQQASLFVVGAIAAARKSAPFFQRLLKDRSAEKYATFLTEFEKSWRYDYG